MNSSIPEALDERKGKKKKKKHALLAAESNGATNGEADGRSDLIPRGDHKPKRHKIDNEYYEKELARLQIELVKLQEWIKQEGLKVVVLFEGRDAAGKGGVIKRITEPSILGSVAWWRLGSPSERERTSWYFQRYVAHLPSAGEMVLFDRSWYNRAGVEHVMGFCTEAEYQDFLAQLSRVRANADSFGNHFGEVLVFGQRRGARAPFSMAHERSDAELEIEPDGHRVASSLGGVFACQRSDVRPHGHEAIAVARGEGRQ